MEAGPEPEVSVGLGECVDGGTRLGAARSDAKAAQSRRPRRAARVFIKDLFGKPLPAEAPDVLGVTAPEAIHSSAERVRTHLVESYEHLHDGAWSPCRSCALDDMEDDWWDSYTAESLLIAPTEDFRPTVGQRWMMHEIAFEVRATNENLVVVPAVRRHGWSCGTKTVFGLGVGAVVLGATFGGLTAGGAFSGSHIATSQAHSASAPTGPLSLAGSLPTLFNRQLQFSATGSGPPSTYTVILQPTSTAGQFVETQVYPAERSQQVTNESFSASGVEVRTVQTTSPTGTSDENFTAPLLLLKAPYSEGTSWDSTATSTSPGGVQNTVQAMDRITGIEQLTLAGRTLQVVVVDLHHVVTQTTMQGLATQVSTGTVYFSPLLGVIVSGQSQEVTSEPGQAPRTAANQFQLENIG